MTVRVGELTSEVMTEPGPERGSAQPQPSTGSAPSAEALLAMQEKARGDAARTSAEGFDD